MLNFLEILSKFQFFTCQDLRKFQASQQSFKKMNLNDLLKLHYYFFFAHLVDFVYVPILHLNLQLSIQHPEKETRMQIIFAIIIIFCSAKPPPLSSIKI